MLNGINRRKITRMKAQQNKHQLKRKSLRNSMNISRLLKVLRKPILKIRKNSKKYPFRNMKPLNIKTQVLLQRSSAWKIGKKNIFFRANPIKTKKSLKNIGRILKPLPRDTY